MCPFSIAMLVYRSVTGMILQVVESPPLVPHRLTSPMTSPPFATKAAASAGARPKPIPRAMPRAPGLLGGNVKEEDLSLRIRLYVPSERDFPYHPILGMGFRPFLL